MDKTQLFDINVDQMLPGTLQKFVELEQSYEEYRSEQTQAEPTAQDVQEGDEIEISEFFCFWRVNFERGQGSQYLQQYHFLVFEKDAELFDKIPDGSNIDDNDVKKAFNQFNNVIRVKMKRTGNRLPWDKNLKVEMANGQQKMLAMYEVQLQNDTNDFFEYNYENPVDYIAWNHWYKFRYNEWEGKDFEELQGPPFIESCIGRDGEHYQITFSVEHSLQHTEKFSMTLSPGENGLSMSNINIKFDSDDVQGKNPCFPMTGTPKLEIFQDLQQLPSDSDSKDIKAGLVWMIPNSDFFANNVRGKYSQISTPQTVQDASTFRLKFTMHEMKGLVQSLWAGQWPHIESYFMYENRPFIPVSFMKRTPVAHVGGGCMYVPENSGVFCEPENTALLLQTALEQRRFSKAEPTVFLFHNIKLQEEFDEVKQDLDYVDDLDFLIGNGSNDPKEQKLISRYQYLDARRKDEEFLAKVIKIQDDNITLEYLEDSQNLSGSQTIEEFLIDGYGKDHTDFVSHIVSDLHAKGIFFASDIDSEYLTEMWTANSSPQYHSVLEGLQSAKLEHDELAKTFWKRGDQKDLRVSDHVCVLAMQIPINKYDWKFAENFVIWDDCPSRKFDDNIVGFETTEENAKELGQYAEVVKNLCPHCQDVMIHRQYSEANVLHPRTRFELMQCLYHQYERESERHRNHEYLTRSECMDENQSKTNTNT